MSWIPFVFTGLRTSRCVPSVVWQSPLGGASRFLSTPVVGKKGGAVAQIPSAAPRARRVTLGEKQRFEEPTSKGGVMSRSKALRTVKGEDANSTRWMQRQLTDKYVLSAHQQGLRSRAAFKLLEMQRSARFMHPGMKVLELGASPGGMTQVLSNTLGPAGFVVAVDTKPMAPIDGVRFLRMPILPESIVADVQRILDSLRFHWHQTGKDRNGLFDGIVSDMAPAATGDSTVDHLRLMVLAETAFEVSKLALERKTGSFLLTKVSNGTDDIEFKRTLRDYFGQVTVLKPPASRAGSREYYLLATINPPPGKPADKISPPDVEGFQAE